MTPYPDSEYPSILRGKDKRESQRLLAAAPEMLAALKSMVAMVESEYAGFDSVPEWQKATAAIAKAEGRSDETTPN
jgi:hypothetical protein